MTARAPGLRYEVVPFTADAKSALARGTADFAIDVFPDPLENCRVEHLFVDRFACVVRTGHPVLADGLTSEAYAALDHIEITGTGAFVTILEQELGRLGVRRTVMFSTTSMTTAPFVASQTDWIATVPSARARRSVKRFGVEMVPLPYPVREIPLSVLWHDRTDASPLHRWMRGCLPKVEMPR
jgi:DNA-binding transcriptional LysR family regulator